MLIVLFEQLSGKAALLGGKVKKFLIKQTSIKLLCKQLGNFTTATANLTTYIDNYLFHTLDFFIITAATIEARASENGIELHIHHSHHISEKIERAGTRNSNCRERERNILTFALPILWKKLVTTIWNPTIGNIIIIILMAVLARFINDSSLVNSLAHGWAANIATRNPTVQTTVAQDIASFTTLRRRS